MARVTVEDCVLKIPNRFDLVMLAAQRARDVSSGASLTVERDNDKNPVVALREIADETVDIEGLAESLIQGMQKHVEVDEPEEDITEFDLPGLTAEAVGESLMAEIAQEALASTEDNSAEAEPESESGAEPDGDTEGEGSETAEERTDDEVT